MDEPLGMKGEDRDEIIKNIVKMDLESDEHGFVYFNELLFKTMKRVYGDEHMKNRILVEHELKVLKKIHQIRLKMQKKSDRLDQEKMSHIGANVNPFLLKMYKHMSFKAWIKMFHKNQEKRKQEKQYVQLQNFEQINGESD